MALALLVSIADGLFIGLLDEQEVILTKDLMNNRGRWVADTAMPPGRRGLHDAVGLFIDARLQRTEPASHCPLCRTFLIV